MESKRKIIQISTVALIGDNVHFGNNHITTALCNDGSIWTIGWNLGENDGIWHKVEDIPQD